MSMDSLMLRSVYSHVKKPLRNTPVSTRAIDRKEEGNSIGGIGIGEGKRENIRERCT